jgi:sugar phosphate isomerase/epimerase
MNNPPASSRRDFFNRTALAASGVALAGSAALGADEPAFAPPLALFSKIYQELKLDFDQAAELTAETGLDGLDIPVRPGGEIAPERAAEDLPRYAEALRKRKKDVLLLTTAILGRHTPHAEDILRAAGKLGVRYYRLGFASVGLEADATKDIARLRAQLKELAALNRELGLTAVFQNHSPGGRTRNVGGDLRELYELVQGFNPAEIGVAFDLGHALIVHGAEWPAHFAKLKSHIQVVYVKDTSKDKRFVRFGQGEFSRTDWFTRLKKMGYHAPISIHIEFDWRGPDQARTREALRQAVQESVSVLRQWLARA